LCLSKIIEALSGSSFECQTPMKNRMKNNTVLVWNVHSLSVKQSEKLFSRQYVHHDPELLRDNVSACYRSPVTQLPIHMVSCPLQARCSVSQGQYGTNCWSVGRQISCMQSVSDCL
jgi:hypothetical protein